MPALIPIVAAAATIGLSAAATAGVISLTVATIASIGISIAAGLAQGFLAGNARRNAAPLSRAAEQSLRQETASRLMAVGQVRAGFRAHPAYAANASNQFVRAGVYNHGRVHAVDRIELNGEAVTLDPNGFVTGSADGKWDGNVRIVWNFGRADQVALPELVADWAPWTSEHRCAGCALMYVRQDPVASNDPRSRDLHQELGVNVIFRGADDVFDPRTNSTGYTDNAALIYAYVASHPDVGRLATSEINWPEIAIAADVCDLPIALAAGGTEPQFRCAGWIDLAEDPRSVLAEMLGNMDAIPTWDSEGRHGIRIGNQPVTNNLTFPERAIKSETFRSGARSVDVRNVVVAEMVSPDHDHRTITLPPFEDAASIAEIGRRTRQLSLPYCPSVTQGQRLAKMALRRGLATDVGSVVTDLSGRFAYPGATVRLGYLSAGTDLPLRVTARERVDQTTISLAVRSIDPGETDWSVADEKPVQALPAVSASGRLLGAPANVGLAASNRALNARTPGLDAHVTWDDPNDSTVIAEIQIRAATGPFFGNQTVPSSQGEIFIGPIQDSLSYDAWVRFIGSGGRPTDWSVVEGVTLRMFDTALAETPIAISTGSADTNETFGLTATPPDESEAFRVKFWRASVDDFSTATEIADLQIVGATVLYSHAEASVGTFYYWATTTNLSGVDGLESAAPVSITISSSGGGS